jgi:hypothetical protein
VTQPTAKQLKTNTETIHVWKGTHGLLYTRKNMGESEKWGKWVAMEKWGNERGHGDGLRRRSGVLVVCGGVNGGGKVVWECLCRHSEGEGEVWHRGEMMGKRGKCDLKRSREASK